MRIASAFQTQGPDILEVISNLSSDEVFTPPAVANAMLDLLPQSVWRDPDLRWFDPGCKTGVFLREVTKRLMDGLADAFPSEEDRLDHILKNMVFGAAITDLTSLMARRTLYCSTSADGSRSATRMNTPDGNVWFERVPHSFDDRGRCTECLAPKGQFGDKAVENHAYGFVHAVGREAIGKEISMKFDVIVGNPPYHMTGGGGGSNDTPLYHSFVEEAIKLNPQYISMVIPSRWMAGGRGLEDFRSSMLADKRVRHLVDYPVASELFPGVEIKGGVCFFLWDRANSGPCEMTVRRGDTQHGPISRQLDEFDILVRDSRALDILRKVLSHEEASFSELVSGDTPFGIPSNFRGYRKSKGRPGDLKLLMNEGGTRVEKVIDPALINKNSHLIRKWKVFIPKAGSDGGQRLPDSVLGTPVVADKSSVCSQTYLVIGPFDTKDEAESALAYTQTRFARFLVSLRKISQDAMKSVYTWVPQQSWSHKWTDEDLYAKYGIDDEERTYIESMIKGTAE